VLPGGHSTQVGESIHADQFLYGKFEATDVLPDLDACGGHFGFTPDSPNHSVYHYHVQDKPPFTFGCYGPNTDGTMVTLAECRALHDECGNGDETSLTVGASDILPYTLGQTVAYDPWCPCYDLNGSNVGNVKLAFEAAGGSSTASPTPAPTETEQQTLSEGSGSALHLATATLAIAGVVGAVVA